MRKIAKTACLEWAARAGKTTSASVFNHTAGILRKILEIAVDSGAIYDNPACFIQLATDARQHQSLPAIERVRHWRRKSFLRFRCGIRRPDMLPLIFRGLRVYGQQIRLNTAWLGAPAVHRQVALQDLQVKPAFEKQQARGEGPLKREVTVVFLKIALPEFLSGKNQTYQLTIAAEKHEEFAVYGR